MPNIGLVYALSAGADSIRTFDQSASSSSASSMGNDVVTPWPISERSTTTRTLSSAPMRDRKSTRLNSSHSQISYAVFCLKKKKEQDQQDCSTERQTDD